MPENVNISPLGNVVEQDTKQDDRPVMVNVDHVSMVFNMASARAASEPGRSGSHRSAFAAVSE